VQYITPGLTHQVNGIDILTFFVMLFPNMMVTRPRIEYIVITLLLGLLILSACQQALTPEGTPAPLPNTASVVPSASPYPMEPEKTETTSPAYPEPGVSFPTDIPAEAYPQPGSGATLAPSATQNSTLIAIGTPSPPSAGPYPPPGTTGESPNEPYPGPSSADLLTTPGASAQPTIVDATSVPLLTPTTTPTLGLLSTELKATDPTTFRVASGELQLVEFFAFWSPESQSMAPVMNVLEQRNGDRLRFVYLDIDDPANNLYKTLLTNRLPPVFFLLDGQGNVLHEWQGYIELVEFEEGIAEALQ
jgi:thiol-disulfide isomerase/thioredoxin